MDSLARLTGFEDFSRNALPRGLASFFGAFSLLNILGELRSHRFDANLWWIDLRWLPGWLAMAVLTISGLSLVAFAANPPKCGWRRLPTMGCVGFLAVVALMNAVQFYALLARSEVTAAIPIPLSLGVGASLVLIFSSLWRSDSRLRGRNHPIQVLLVCVGCFAAFPLAQMLCFGKTDYRRPADIAVVLGARAYADGRPSDALADRVRTACDLYGAGLVKKLFLSGGPGDGDIHETESMKRMAVSLGVKSEDILEMKRA